jgi:hypothetical protein
LGPDSPPPADMSRQALEETRLDGHNWMFEPPERWINAPPTCIFGCRSTGHQAVMRRAVAYLRHGAVRDGSRGEVRFEDLAFAANIPWSEEMFEHHCALDAKGRFAKTSHGFIATNGHSYDSCVPLKVPASGRVVAYHATSITAAKEIAKHGISSMKRVYVHLTKDPNSHASLGKLPGFHTIFEVDIGQMRDDGLEVLESMNGYILVRDNIPRCYLARRTRCGCKLPYNSSPDRGDLIDRVWVEGPAKRWVTEDARFDEDVRRSRGFNNY